MQEYKEIVIDIVFLQKDDIVTTSPGGIKFDKDEDDDKYQKDSYNRPWRTLLLVGRRGFDFCSDV